jgi:hypothetical protein
MKKSFAASGRCRGPPPSPCCAGGCTSASQCAWVSVTILSAALASPGVVDRSSFFDLPAGSAGARASARASPSVGKERARWTHSEERTSRDCLATVKRTRYSASWRCLQRTIRGLVIDEPVNQKLDRMAMRLLFGQVSNVLDLPTLDQRCKQARQRCSETNKLRNGAYLLRREQGSKKWED